MRIKKLTEEISALKNPSREEVYSTFLAKGFKIEEIQAALDAKPSEVTDSVSKESTKKAQKSDNLTNILGIVGSVILGMGVLSLVASNWPNLSSEWKLIILIFSILALHISGLVTRFIFGFKFISNALHLAGSIVFGASLFLIGQMYNLPINWTDSFYIWIIGVAILGFVLNDYLQDYLALAIVSVSGISSLPFLFYSYGGYYPNQELREYTTLGLQFLTILVFIIWATKHRLSNSDKSLNKVF